MGWKRAFRKIEMPDENDPKVKERAEMYGRAGSKVARCLRLGEGVAYLQVRAQRHPRWALAICIAVIILILGLNVRNVVLATKYHNAASDWAKETVQTASGRKHVEKILLNQTAVPDSVANEIPNGSEKVED